MSNQPIPDIQTPLADSVRQSYLDFFKANGHSEVPNVSLVPNNDSTLLFTNSGMFPLVTYLAGQPHPLGKRLVNFQRCIRTGEDDIAEIGDWKHTTMFEMMGNWSLGDYFKGEQIPWVFQLYVEKFGLNPDRLYVTVFAGDADAPRDTDSIELWQKAFASVGIKAELAPVEFVSEDGRDVAYHVDEQGNRGERWDDFSLEAHPEYRIFMYPKKKNWWQRGAVAGELGGPDSEIFFDTKAFHDADKFGAVHPNSDSDKFLEIGNSVFIQYRLDEQLLWQELPQKNVDFGGGFVRVLLAKQEVKDLFETEIFAPIIQKLEQFSGKRYKDEQGNDNEYTKYFRIVADHVFGSTFIIADGITPARKEQGYILRRLIRRAIRMGKQLGIEREFLAELSTVVIGIYQRHYNHLAGRAEAIQSALQEEEQKFSRTLQAGLKELRKLESANIDGETLFKLFETYGFPLELSLEELQIVGDKAASLAEEFAKAEVLHRSESRAGAEQKFTGGLADSSLETTRLHTTHHLLLRALQEVVGPHVHQKGSNITGERLRLDFSTSEKVTPEQLEAITSLVNEKIAAHLDVLRVELPIAEAEKIGAEHEFGQKYGERVSVYLIGNFGEQKDDLLALSVEAPAAFLAKLNEFDVFSKEFCGGPHVENTSEIAAAGTFKIMKEESSGSGVRRIKATVS